MSGRDLPDDPDVLRADIELTRQELGDTVEALVHKVDVPARVKENAHERVEQVKQRGQQVKEKATAVAGQAAGALPPPVRRHPAALVAGVVALLLVLWQLTRGRRA
ncbi:DUF3618 domain-containing protein [Saccharothrix coeruleofusca]|uniref:DUF3618 domain-containing protein n=1 Tax=Saccharothrix coeruleofusca TaxID=33919 RepID=A0A918ASV7_9PSEU|nr:DUF3618 domain-containing protein [Saccharothrix coeruleofusca]GGP71728.1 hypothetical protein GCM10010185_51190 [Saccharothrix coeruleofusca]